jgi:hypothetical protein
MNYISKLQNETNDLKDQLETINRQLTNDLAYLSSEKFQGFENNYVNADEVKRILFELRQTIKY